MGYKHKVCSTKFVAAFGKLPLETLGPCPLHFSVPSFLQLPAGGREPGPRVQGHLGAERCSICLYQWQLLLRSELRILLRLGIHFFLGLHSLLLRLPLEICLLSFLLPTHSWQAVFHGSVVFLHNLHLSCKFVLDYLFTDVVERFWKMKSQPLEQRTGLLTTLEARDSVFLESKRQTYCSL